MDFHFKLILIGDNRGAREKIYAAEWIKQVKSGDTSFQLDVESSTIDFFYKGITFISQDWNLGKLDWLLPQLQNAFEKLQANELVLVRSAVIEGSEIPYLVFEPTKEKVKISLVTFDDYEIEQIFPAGPFSEKSKGLYTYFYAFKDKYFHLFDTELLNNPDFTEIFKDKEVPIDSLLENLAAMIEELSKVLYIRRSLFEE